MATAIKQTASKKISLSERFKRKKGPFVIGVAGGTASGKSRVCQKIVEAIEKETKKKSIVCISQESFYRNLTAEELEQAKKGNFNFDHPDAFDVELMNNTLSEICDRKTVYQPKYDHKEFRRVEGLSEIQPADIVLFEGILSFYWPELRDKYDMKLFVDTDADTRLARRVKRDTEERGRVLDIVLNQYINTVKPAFEDFCLPTKKFADIIIPRGEENLVAIDLIVQSLKDILANGANTAAEIVSDPVTHTPQLIKRNSDSKNARLH